MGDGFVGDGGDVGPITRKGRAAVAPIPQPEASSRLSEQRAALGQGGLCPVRLRAGIPEPSHWRHSATLLHAALSSAGRRWVPQGGPNGTVAIACAVA